MSDVWIAIMLGAGVGGWVYSKIYRRSGGSSMQSIATSIIAAILAFMTMLTVLKLIG